MFSIANTNLGQEALASLKSHQIALAAKDGTPLRELQLYSYSDNRGIIADSPGVVGEDPHETALASIVALGTSTIRGSIARARNIVRPLAAELAQAADEAYESSIPGSTYRVIPELHSPLFDNSSFIALTEKFAVADKPTELLPRELRLNLTEGQLSEFIKTGTQSIDEEVEKMLVTRKGYLIEFMEAAVNRLELAAYATPNDIALGFVITRGLLSNVAEYAPDSPGTTAFLAGIMAYFGNRVVTVNARRELRITTQNIIREVKGRDVMVNSDTYNRWLKAGGKPEIIMGAAILGEINVTGATLLERGDAYARSYQRYMMNEQNRTIINKRAFKRKAIAKSLLEHIKADEAYKAILGELSTRLVSERDTIDFKNPDDSYSYALTLIGRVLFPNTDVLEIINGIDALCAANPQLTVRDAGSAVYHEQVVKWMLSQVEFKKISDENYYTGNETFTIVTNIIQISERIMNEVAGNEISDQVVRRAGVLAFNEATAIAIANEVASQAA